MLGKSTLTAVLAVGLALAAPAAAADQATAVLKDAKGNEVGKAHDEASNEQWILAGPDFERGARGEGLQVCRDVRLRDARRT